MTTPFRLLAAVSLLLTSGTASAGNARNSAFEADCRLRIEEALSPILESTGLSFELEGSLNLEKESWCESAVEVFPLLAQEIVDHLSYLEDHPFRTIAVRKPSLPHNVSVDSGEDAETIRIGLCWGFGKYVWNEAMMRSRIATFLKGKSTGAAWDEAMRARVEAIFAKKKAEFVETLLRGPSVETNRDVPPPPSPSPKPEATPSDSPQRRTLLEQVLESQAGVPVELHADLNLGSDPSFRSADGSFSQYIEAVRDYLPDGTYERIVIGAAADPSDKDGIVSLGEDGTLSIAVYWRPPRYYGYLAVEKSVACGLVRIRREIIERQLNEIASGCGLRVRIAENVDLKKESWFESAYEEFPRYVEMICNHDPAALGYQILTLRKSRSAENIPLLRENATRIELTVEIGWKFNLFGSSFRGPDRSTEERIAAFLRTIRELRTREPQS